MFRYAGDEFVVLLSETDSETADAISNRVRAVLSTSPFALPDGTVLRISVTIGIATHPVDGTSLADLIVAAQHRLAAQEPSAGSIAPGIH